MPQERSNWTRHLFQKQFSWVGRQVVVEGEVRMADSVVFNFVCERIEGLTILDRLESRGTVRSALKPAVRER